MWLCFNDAFLSVVADTRNPDRLLVRARDPDHLRVLVPGHEILLHAGTDYIARVSVPREEVSAVVAERIKAISYPNFKNSVRDGALRDLYAEFWELHWSYQQEMSASRA